MIQITSYFMLSQSSKTFKIRTNRATFSCFWRPQSHTNSRKRELDDLLTLISSYFL